MSRTCPADRRPDYRQVKYICDLVGTSAALAWQQAPFVDVELEKLEELMNGDGMFDVTTPWHRFVLALRYEDRVVSICATTTDPRDLLPARFHKKVVELAAYADAFSERNQVPADYCYILIPDELGMLVGALLLWDCKPHVKAPPQEHLMHTLDACHNVNAPVLLIDALRYADRVAKFVCVSNRHITEVRAVAPQVTRGSKTAKLKPWLRDDLVRIILLDPQEAAQHHGMPTGKTVAARRAPMPHGRRGHWRRYRHLPNPVWVRPCWIGPTEWQNHGQIYRVLTAQTEEKTK